MTTELDANRKNLYETDYLKWIETTVEKLRVRDYSSVDWMQLNWQVLKLNCQWRHFPANVPIHPQKF